MQSIICIVISVLKCLERVCSSIRREYSDDFSYQEYNSEGDSSIRLYNIYLHTFDRIRKSKDTMNKARAIRVIRKWWLVTKRNIEKRLYEKLDHFTRSICSRGIEIDIADYLELFSILKICFKRRYNFVSKYSVLLKFITNQFIFFIRNDPRSIISCDSNKIEICLKKHAYINDKLMNIKKK